MTKTINPKVKGYNSHRYYLRNLREGHLISVDNRVARVTSTGMEPMGGSWHYSASYLLSEDGDRKEVGIISGPGDRPVSRLYPVPKVGDGATSQVGSDRYPYTVTKVSASGASIEVRRCKARVISGTFQGNDTVIEYEETEWESTPARWSRVKGCFVSKGGSRFHVGHRDYYQDPHR